MLLIAILLLAPQLIAQESPRVELFAGYSGNNQSTHGFAIGRVPLYGWGFDADLNLNRWVGVEMALSQHFGSATLGLQGSSTLYLCPYTTCASQAYIAQHAALTSKDILFGPRVTLRHEKHNVFLHALFGPATLRADFAATPALPRHTGYNTASSTLAGGGLDHGFGHLVALRLELDYFRTNFFHSAQNSFRFAPGIVFRFGGTE